MKTLTELANEFGTDKGTRVGNRHCYTLVYEKLFSDWRDRDFRLLEIGLSIGGPEQGFTASRNVSSVPSVDMWLSYFPKAHVVGLDISDCSGFRKERFEFIQADCGDQSALRSAAHDRRFDLIVDDGSHASFHQQLTMLEFLPTLEPGGYYIIEDLDWQPKAYEEELPPVAKTADLISWLARRSWKDTFGLFNERRWMELMEQIDTIELYRKEDLELLAREHRYERMGFFRKRRIERRKRYLGELANPIKLAIIRKRR